MIFYTHVEHSSIQTTHTKHHTERQTTSPSSPTSITTLFPFSPTLIILVVSVDVKHHVYLRTTLARMFRDRTYYSSQGLFFFGQKTVCPKSKILPLFILSAVLHLPKAISCHSSPAPPPFPLSLPLSPSLSWSSSLKGQERAIVNQTNTGTVSKATLVKLLRDEVERIKIGISDNTILN